VIAAPGLNERLVGVVEVEVAREVVGRWVTTEAAVDLLQRWRIGRRRS
jgi:hypothetical protein